MQPVYARGDDPLPASSPDERTARPSVCRLSTATARRCTVLSAAKTQTQEASPSRKSAVAGTLVRPVSAGRYETLTIVFMPGAGIGSVPAGIPSRTV